MTIHFFGDSNAAGKKAVPASFYLEGLHEVENHAECDLPPGLPGNAVGFWMRDCRLSRFDAGEADLTPNPK